MINQIIAIYKPKGPTSHDIVNQIRRITGIKKVGHSGTLDPLASGVLVIGIGREATKHLGSIVNKEKEYIATIKLGETSTTDDAEGEKTRISMSKSQFPIKKNITVALEKFVGEIEQLPPVYSAVKIQGKSAYKYARKGKKVEMKPRKVLIKEIEVICYSWPLLKIRVVTGSGVYIRSLARDIGKKLKTGAYLADLVRTKVGEFILEDAIRAEELS